MRGEPPGVSVGQRQGRAVGPVFCRSGATSGAVPVSPIGAVVHRRDHAAQGTVAATRGVPPVWVRGLRWVIVGGVVVAVAAAGGHAVVVLVSLVGRQHAVAVVVQTVAEFGACALLHAGRRRRGIVWVTLPARVLADAQRHTGGQRLQHGVGDPVAVVVQPVAQRLHELVARPGRVVGLLPAALPRAHRERPGAHPGLPLGRRRRQGVGVVDGGVAVVVQPVAERLPVGLVEIVGEGTHPAVSAPTLPSHVPADARPATERRSGLELLVGHAVAVVVQAVAGALGARLVGLREHAAPALLGAAARARQGADALGGGAELGGWEQLRVDEPVAVVVQPVTERLSEGLVGLRVGTGPARLSRAPGRRPGAHSLSQAAGGRRGEALVGEAVAVAVHPVAARLALGFVAWWVGAAPAGGAVAAWLGRRAHALTEAEGGWRSEPFVGAPVAVVVQTVAGGLRVVLVGDGVVAHPAGGALTRCPGAQTDALLQAVADGLGEPFVGLAVAVVVQPVAGGLVAVLVLWTVDARPAGGAPTHGLGAHADAPCVAADLGRGQHVFVDGAVAVVVQPVTEGLGGLVVGRLGAGPALGAGAAGLALDAHAGSGALQRLRPHGALVGLAVAVVVQAVAAHLGGLVGQKLVTVDRLLPRTGRRVAALAEPGAHPEVERRCGGLAGASPAAPAPVGAASVRGRARPLGLVGVAQLHHAAAARPQQQERGPADEERHPHRALAAAANAAHRTSTRTARRGSALRVASTLASGSRPAGATARPRTE